MRKLYPKTDKSEHIPNYCPFHKEFEPYFKEKNVGKILDKYDIGCKSKCMCFDNKDGLKCHSVGLDDFWHSLLIFIIRHLYEGQPSEYGPTNALPQNNTEQSSSDYESKSNSFEVTR